MNQQEIINLIGARLDDLRHTLTTEGDHVTDEGQENLVVRIRELVFLRHAILTGSRRTVVIHRRPWVADKEGGTVTWATLHVGEGFRAFMIKTLREAKAYARRSKITGYRVRIVTS